MKVRLSRKVLSEMPASLRAIVQSWQARSHKAFISVTACESFCAEENARVTLVNLQNDKSARAQVAGDFAGMTHLSPTAQIPLSPDVVAVEDGFFCGVPFLTVYQWAPKQLSS